MINHHVVESAAHAENYFKESLADGRAEYYKEENAPERWGGRGAELAGLKPGDAVASEDFRNLFNGQVVNPGTGEIQKLENNKGEHRPGIDLPVAAPKSVSIVALVGGDERVMEAHRAAADRAIAYVESVAGTRVREGGHVSEKATGNLVYAAFDHQTSRALDPHLHTHYVVANATFDKDAGKWRSLNYDSVVRELKTADAIYKNELARELKSLGYEVEWSKHGPEIKGVSREQVETFSKRLKQIDEVLESKDLSRENSTGSQRNVAALTDRSAKVHESREVLAERWQTEAKAVGLDVERLVSEATSRAQSGKVVSFNEVAEARTALAHAVAHLGERESAFTRRDLLEAANSFALGKTTASHIERAMVLAEKDGALIEKADTVKGRKGEDVHLITTKEAVELEKDAVRMVKSGKGAADLIANFQTVQAELEAFEGKAGFALNAGQRDAAVKILTSYDRAFAVQGFAGTGKTTMLQAVKEIAEASGYEVVGMSPYAAQAAVLQADSGIKAGTVASFLNERSKTTAGDGQGNAAADRLDPKTLSQARTDLANGTTKQLKAELSQADRALARLNAPRKEVHGQDIDAFGVVPKGRYLFTKEGTFMAETGAGAFLNQAAFALKDKFRENRIAAEKANSVFKALGNRFMERAAASMVQWRKVDPITAGLARAVGFQAQRKERMAIEKKIEQLETRIYGPKLTDREREQIASAKAAGLLNWSSPSSLNRGPAEGHAPEVAEHSNKASDDKARKRELWVVDEASLLTQNELNSLMKLAEKHGAKILFTGDVKQHQAVGAGKPLDVLHQAGIASATLTEVRRQRETNIKGRAAYSALVPGIRFHDEKGLKAVRDKGSAAEALAHLDVRENRDNQALIGELAKEYARDGGNNSIIVTALNKDRHDINDAVRSELKASGDLQKEGSRVVSLEKPGLTETESKFAHSYAVGQVVEAGRDYKSLGVAKGERLSVVSIDAGRNVVKLQGADGREVIWNPEREKKMSSFNTREIELAIGDRIRFTKNNKPEGRLNGLTGEVVDRDGSLVTIRSGKRTHIIDTAEMQHLGYAYATTSYGAQGRTEERALYHINAEKGQGVGERSFYIAITRAKDDTQVFTTSKERASELVERAQDKTSAVDRKALERLVNEEHSIPAEAQQPEQQSVGRSR